MESYNKFNDKEDGEHLLYSRQKSATNDMDKYLSICETADIHNNDLSKSSSIDLDLIENDEDDELIPTTNAADHIEISAEIVYGGPKNDFQISNSGMLYE